MGNILADIDRAQARHQPEWDNPSQVELVRAMLSSVTPLVTAAQVENLRSHLARVATGEMQVLQAGDCAEDPAECTAGHIQGKTGLIDLLAQNLETATGKQTLRVGRIAGQFSKPRSSRVEKLGDAELPSFFGHMINGPEPTHESRRPDPLRMLTGYMAAREIMMQLGWVGSAPRLDGSVVWSSHEALLLDYEISMLRELDGGRHWLGSTHWPWIGERTRQINGPHVALLAQVVNPVACKVGPSMTVSEIVELCDRLDPEREPGGFHSSCAWAPTSSLRGCPGSSRLCSRPGTRWSGSATRCTGTPIARLTAPSTGSWKPSPGKSAASGGSWTWRGFRPGASPRGDPRRRDRVRAGHGRAGVGPRHQPV